MRTIIAGSRVMTQAQVDDAMTACPWVNEITDAICGCAPGADRAGWEWAYRILPVQFFPAWPDQLRWAHGALKQSMPGSAIHLPDGGDYNRGLGNGHARNAAMGRYAQALVAVWDGQSNGTRGMISIAKTSGLRIWPPIPSPPAR